MMSGFANAGSQRWLQIAAELRPEVLNAAVLAALDLPTTVQIDWRSPRAHDEFREYRDTAALRLLGIDSLEHRSLSEFWPARGPVWDALALTSDGQFLFVETKAHIPELASPGCRATSASMKLISDSLAEARHHFAPKATADWSGLFYQYANRLAHHYLLRHINGLPAHTVFLHFLNAEDVKGPRSELEWRGAIRLVHAVLGLGERIDPYVHDIFVDVADLAVAV